MFSLDTISPLNWLGNLIPSFVFFGLSFAGEGEEGGGAGANWRDSLPDDIKSDPIWEKYNDPVEAHRALVASQKFLGREKLPVPIDENDSETYGIIHKRLGLPDKPESYQLPTDLKIPDGLPIDENMLTNFRKTAHELGILPKQFAGMYKWYMTEIANQYNKYNEDTANSMKEAETALRGKWGADYGQNEALAKKVFQTFMDEKSFAEFEKGLGNNPIIIEMFANIGKVLSEDQLKGKPDTLQMTPAEAQSKIQVIKNDMNHAYWKSEHPGHADAVAEMERLMKFVTA